MFLHLPDLLDPVSDRFQAGAGLTLAECFALADAARRLPGEWFTLEHEDRGRTIALVLPRDDRDQRMPLFLVWRTRRLLHLCMGQGTKATDLGRSASIADVIASVEREVRCYLPAL